MADVFEQNLKEANKAWATYLNKILRTYLADPYLRKEIKELKPLIDELRKDGEPERNITAHLFLFYLWDWKIPEWLASNLLELADRGTTTISLDKSPIKFANHRMGIIHPSSNPKGSYTKKYGQKNNAYSMEVSLIIEPGISSKDIKQFVSTYFNDVIDPTLNLSIFTPVGKRRKTPNHSVRQVINDCLAKGITDDSEIASELDKRFPIKNTRRIDGWSPDAVRLQRKAIGVVHDNNPYRNETKDV